jgi:hypothetical protein
MAAHPPTLAILRADGELDFANSRTRFQNDQVSVTSWSMISSM